MGKCGVPDSCRLDWRHLFCPFVRNFKRTFHFCDHRFFSIFAEHLGVEYGILFGDYYYTQDFGPKLIGVPIAIGFAWLMVIASSHALAKVIAYKKMC